MNFKFTTEYPDSKIDEIVSYLLGPRLWIPQVDYPDFNDWAQKAHTELKKNQKRAVIALSGNEVVGVTIYQQHKKYEDALEIKNLTVRPDQRGRYIASFLLRNSEIEGQRDFKSKYVLCDAKVKNLPIMFFLQRNKYNIVGKTDLYNLQSGEDVIYRKDFIKTFG